MNYWIFQGSPRIFNVTEYIKKQRHIVWEVKQKHFAGDMYPGDEVFIWRATGGTKEQAGIVAYGHIENLPREMADDSASKGLWKLGDPTAVELRVRIELARKCFEAKNCVKREWLQNDPIVNKMLILKQAAGTNYRITAAQAQRLKSLVFNTGRDWTREECIAGLWAYDNTRGKTISKGPESTVAEVALQIGRAVTGVYNKVMNFRAIDPSDSRKGLDRGSHGDEAVWNEFFDKSTGELNHASLDEAMRAHWAEYTEDPIPKVAYRDFGDAPNDDPEELANFAARVRRGQPEFRKNLLSAYDNRCAISDHGPVEVLEAVHIVPHAKAGINELNNGLLMRSDLHALYDAGLLSIQPETLAVQIHDGLKATPYWQFNGKKLRARVDGTQVAEKYLAIAWKNKNSEAGTIPAYPR